RCKPDPETRLEGRATLTQAKGVDTPEPKLRLEESCFGRSWEIRRGIERRDESIGEDASAQSEAHAVAVRKSAELHTQLRALIGESWSWPDEPRHLCEELDALIEEPRVARVPKPTVIAVEVLVERVALEKAPTEIVVRQPEAEEEGSAARPEAKKRD